MVLVGDIDDHVVTTNYNCLLTNNPSINGHWCSSTIMDTLGSTVCYVELVFLALVRHKTVAVALQGNTEPWSQRRRVQTRAVWVRLSQWWWSQQLPVVIRKRATSISTALLHSMCVFTAQLCSSPIGDVVTTAIETNNAATSQLVSLYSGCLDPSSRVQITTDRLATNRMFV
jgi:hypothetical protein